MQVRTSRRSNRSLAGCIGTVATLLVAVLVAGCSSSFDAQTNQIYQPAIGSNNRDGDVYVLNALVVTEGTGLGTISAGLVNEARRDDVLIGLTADSTEGARVQGSILTNRVGLPSQQLVQLSDAGDVILSSSTPLNVGGSIEVTFTFRNAEPVTLDLPIVMNTGDFARVPVPTPSATPSETPSATPLQTPGTSPTP